MKSIDRNFYPSYKIRMNAEAVAPGASLPAIITEISPDMISIQSKRAVLPSTRISLSFKLKDKVELRGKVVWVLDLCSVDGYHYFQAGIKTESIIHSKVKAVGIAEKSRLLQEILYQIMGKKLN